MQNHDVFLKYENDTLYWSDSATGNYQELKKDTVTCVVNGKDTVTFRAVSGIDKLKKITDGQNGTKKLIKSKSGEDTLTVVATIVDSTVKDEIDKYDIKFQPSGGGGNVTVDPKLSAGGNP